MTRSETTDLVECVPEIYRDLGIDEKIVYSPSIAGKIYSGPKETRLARLAIASLTGLIFADGYPS